MCPFTGNQEQLETALSRNKADGLTALYDAVAVALEQLKKGKWDKKVLIVISDGGDNASSSHSRPDSFDGESVERNPLHHGDL